MRHVEHKGIQFKVDGTDVYVEERTVNRVFKKSGVTVPQHYDEYKPILHIDDKGYVRIVVSINKKSKTFLFHHIIAKAYPEICGEWFEGCIVHHKDHNPSNNDPHNLIVLTRKEHDELHSESELSKTKMSKADYGRTSGFKGHKHTDEANQANREKHSKSIYQLNLLGEVINEFSSGVECSKALGIPRSSICKAALSGKDCYGFKFRYV